jgi:hypothetical protein
MNTDTQYFEFLDNLHASEKLTVGTLRCALQAKYDLTREVARAIVLKWLKQLK